MRRKVRLTARLGFLFSLPLVIGLQPGLQNFVQAAAAKYTIQSQVDPSPDELVAGGEIETIVFTIRNTNESYGGVNRTSSAKLQANDKFRLNLDGCVQSITHVYS